MAEELNFYPLTPLQVTGLFFKEWALSLIPTVKIKNHLISVISFAGVLQIYALKICIGIFKQSV